MKVGAVLVNTARGGVVNEAALLKALDDERCGVRKAYLDVVVQEPPAPGSASAELARHPRAVVTPHIAWATEESRGRLAEVAVRNAVEWCGRR